MTSSVARGVQFEREVQHALRRAGLALVRIGGANDKGVDLAGQWELPGSTRIPVLVQCKAHARRLGPREVRELEGALSQQGMDSLGVLAASASFTLQAKRCFSASPAPLVLAHVRDGGIVELMLNTASFGTFPRLSVGRQRVGDAAPTFCFLWDGAELAE
mmetsp:Transcript_28631/g.92902  ORF Transcript_28631/g.92902 Transcript_28631/m.92902 type:complete len:160 (-) Transcript_28631:6-485(-)